jgi:D-alanyl-lipoteichoic acid acyltransferase DltB (MBOAT superfamily)
MPPADASAPTHVNVRVALRVGWNRTATHFLAFALVLVLMLLSGAIFEALATLISGGLLHLALQLVGIIVPWALGFGIYKLALPIADDQPVTWRTAWTTYGLIDYLKASGIMILPLVILSVVTFGVAFVLAVPLLVFFPYFILDRDSAGWQSLRQGWTAGAIHYSDMWRLTMTLLLLNLLGFITVLGWFITVPMSAIAIAHAYRTSTGPSGPWH